jgi:hypothetical protein
MIWPCLRTRLRIVVSERIAALLRQLRVDQVPLGLERAAEDRIPGYVGRGFQLIKRSLGL